MRVLKFLIALMLSILAGPRTVSPEVVADDQDPASADRVAVWQATVGDVVGRGGSSATYTVLINRTRARLAAPAEIDAVFDETDRLIAALRGTQALASPDAFWNVFQGRFPRSWVI
jgi:hypothetical protein